MKETIYTIPVNEAFESKCECPLCALERRFENDRVNYYLGPSLMEPENRIETNEIGFCAKHFALMYDTRANRLGLGLIIHTHMQEQNKKIEKLAKSASENTVSEKKGLFSAFKSSGDNLKVAENLLKYVKEQQDECCICRDLKKIMERYCDVILQLYFSEKDFKERFNDGLGFCMPHFAMLLEKAKKDLSGARQEEFLGSIIKMQVSNMKRIEAEVEWFTKKFDYRNKDADWGNSKDAIPRSIEKLTGLTELDK